MEAVDVDLATQADFARSMQVSRAAVGKWAKQGRIVMRGGLVDVAASRAMLAAHRSPSAGGRAAPALPAPVPAAAEDEDEADAAGISALAEEIIRSTGAAWSYDEARRVKENYRALIGRLQYDKDSGSVVAVETVAAHVGADYAQVRTRILSIPAERAPEIHRCRTVEEVRDALERVLTEALEAISDG